MAATPQIQAPQAGILTVTRQSAQMLRLPQGLALSVYNIPAKNLHSTAALINAPVHVPAKMSATQAVVLAVVKGTTGTPKLRTWGFTLDSHDMIVIKLGTDAKTLMFDLSTQKWSWWCSEGRSSWRPSCGMNWRSSGSIPSNYGSNIVAGDDSSGQLWVLNPKQGYDDSIFDDDPRSFERIATGYIVQRGRWPLQCYTVDLEASFGMPSLTANSVVLSYSDDAGHDYIVADEPKMSEVGNYQQSFRWDSLGLITSPGRLFRITDDGAFARLDGLYVNQDLEAK